ncbi:MAG: 5,10-methylenetetrahydrofolate reductase [Gammaproteobacteria bacterium]|jgi:methylenetetrahydrofolate reductase (NADPH)|nr:5,10-methylenetetrahydrofolate reductase [Gammaproteobacteria bacterium]
MHFSVEFFPPKSEEATQYLVEVAHSFHSEYQPDFFSVTFGAGGSTQGKTLETVKLIKDLTSINTAAHLSCIGFNQVEMRELLMRYQAQGLKHLVALRGDIPSGMFDIGDFKHASELVAFIRQETGPHFNIAVAAYPEYHPQASHPDQDLLHFVNKVKNGANLALTQYFYNADAYFNFVDQCQKHQIDIPIIPGVMPINNYKQLARFSDMCGAEIPRWIRQRLAHYDALEDKASIEAFGIEVVTNLTARLLKNGAPGLHFYSMNKFEPTHKILQNLKLS